MRKHFVCALKFFQIYVSLRHFSLLSQKPVGRLSTFNFLKRCRAPCVKINFRKSWSIKRPVITCEDTKKVDKNDKKTVKDTDPSHQDRKKKIKTYGFCCGGGFTPSLSTSWQVWTQTSVGGVFTISDGNQTH